jgi:hypothetical protein
MDDVNYLAARETRTFKKTKEDSGAVRHEPQVTHTLISREVFRTYDECKAYCNKKQNKFLRAAPDGVTTRNTYVIECNFPMPDTLIMTDEVYEAQLKTEKK